VIDVAARGLDDVINGFIIHVSRANAADILVAVSGHKAGAVKRIDCNDLQILDFDRISRTHSDATIFRHAPANPFFHGFHRTNEGNGFFYVLHHCRSIVHIDMIVVVVGGEHRIHLADRERIHHKGAGTQVRLQQAAAAHVCHLVTSNHILCLSGALAVAQPEVDADVGITGGFDPQPGAAQPPHCHGAWSHNFFLDLFVQPCSPFGKSAHNPGFTCNFINFAHSSPFFFLSTPTT